MRLLDRVNTVGAIKVVEIDGMMFHIKTKNITQRAQFADDLKSISADTEVESVRKLSAVLASVIVSIDDVDNVEEFFCSVPELNDLINIGIELSKELTEKESKNSSSPSESPTSAAVAPTSVGKEEAPVGLTEEK